MAAEVKTPAIVVHAIEKAIARHYKICRRTHGGNDDWFECEARAIAAVAELGAAFELVDAAERWRLDARGEVLGPREHRLLEAIESYRAVYLPEASERLGSSTRGAGG